MDWSVVIFYAIIFYYIALVLDGATLPWADKKLKARLENLLGTEQARIGAVKENIMNEIEKTEVLYQAGEIEEETMRTRLVDLYTFYDELTEEPELYQEELDYMKTTAELMVLKTKLTIMFSQLVFRISSGIPLFIYIGTANESWSLFASLIWMFLYAITSSLVIEKSKTYDSENNFKIFSRVTLASIKTQLPLFVMLLVF